MDLTPDVLHEVDFREARRGYDMREVDEFLERAAVAVEGLIDRLQTAVAAREASAERIAALEHQVAEAAARGGDSPDETIQRTLLLAQKTADAAVADAEAQAAKILTRAEQQASFVMKEADETADRSRIEAESRARRAGEDTRRRLLEEITALERTRETMNSDVRALRRYLDDQRTRMRTAARDLQRLIDDPTALKDLEPPVTSEQRSDDTDSAAATTVAVPVEADQGGASESAVFDQAVFDEGASEAGASVEGVADEQTPEEATATEELPPPPLPPDDTDDADYFEDLRQAMNDAEGAV